jgi:hypothetical protein
MPRERGGGKQQGQGEMCGDNDAQRLPSSCFSWFGSAIWRGTMPNVVAHNLMCKMTRARIPSLVTGWAPEQPYSDIDSTPQSANAV